MSSIKTKTIFIFGILMATIAINILILPYFQNASAFSLNGALNKLFGGLFHKTPKQSSTQSTQTQQNANNTPTPSSSSALPTLPGSTAIPSACHILNGGLPDPKCTPGDL
jgi:hypothetical protein